MRTAKKVYSTIRVRIIVLMRILRSKIMDTTKNNYLRMVTLDRQNIWEIRREYKRNQKMTIKNKIIMCKMKMSKRRRKSMRNIKRRSWEIKNFNCPRVNKLQNIMKITRMNLMMIWRRVRTILIGMRKRINILVQFNRYDRFRQWGRNSGQQIWGGIHSWWFRMSLYNVILNILV